MFKFAEKRTRPTATVTLVAVAVGLMAVSLLMALLAAALDVWNKPLLVVALVLAFVGVGIIAVMYGGFDPDCNWIGKLRVQRSELIGLTVEVRSLNMVFINGALWKAECEEPLIMGEKVEVVEVRGLTLKVTRNPKVVP